MDTEQVAMLARVVIARAIGRLLIDLEADGVHLSDSVMVSALLVDISEQVGLPAPDWLRRDHVGMEQLVASWWQELGVPTAEVLAF